MDSLLRLRTAPARLQRGQIPQEQNGSSLIHQYPQDLKALQRIEIRRQCPVHIVVDRHSALQNISRDQKQEKQDHESTAVSHHEIIEPMKARLQIPMLILFDLVFHQKKDDRQDEQHCKNAEQHTFRHHESDVKPQSQFHEAQGNKTEKGRKGTSCQCGKGLGNGFGHCLFPGIEMRFLLLISVDNGNIEERFMLRDFANIFHNHRESGQIGLPV